MLNQLERGQDVLNRQYYSIIKAKEIEDINAESKFTIQYILMTLVKSLLLDKQNQKIR